MQGRAVVVGAGPNGLTAAAVLARAGLQVEVREAATTAGGALRSGTPLGEGHVVDLGAAVLPFAAASPALSALPLERHGLEWVHPEVPLAHPLDDGSAALLHGSLDRTAEELGRDGRAWRALHAGPVRHWEALVEGALGPLLRVPAAPLVMAGFGARGVWPATALGRALFREERARALLAGSASHAVVPLSRPMTAAFGVLFGAAAAATGWPVARGGSQAVADALVGVLREAGGTLVTGAPVTSLRELGPADLVLLDLTPRQVLRVAGEALPPSYAARLGRWRYGTASLKVDYLLDGPVPWRDARVGRAGTVHLGGTMAEVAAAEAQVHAGRRAERPFVLLAQQSAVDPTRTRDGRQVVWAYAHVPHGDDRPGAEQVTAQVERFAPGFRDRVLAQVETRPADLERWDPNLVGGDIGGGALDGLQQVARPVLARDPYATPVPGLFLCSSSTPPGGGVHGMCGWHAAQSALRSLRARRR